MLLFLWFCIASGRLLRQIDWTFGNLTGSLGTLELFNRAKKGAAGRICVSGYAIYSAEMEGMVARELLMFESQDTIIAGSFDNDFLHQNLLKYAYRFVMFSYASDQSL